MKERRLILNAPMARAAHDGTKTQHRVVVEPQPSSGDHPDTEAAFVRDREQWIEAYGEGMAHSARWSAGGWNCWSEPKFSPLGKPGDRLWVAEAFLTTECVCESGPAVLRGGCVHCGGHGETAIYKEDATCANDAKCCGYKSPIFMPRWASRAALEIVRVWVERLQEISVQDAIAEGIERRGRPDLDDLSRTGFMDYSGKDFATGPGYCIDPRQSLRSLWDSTHASPHQWDDNPWVWCCEFERISK